MALEIWLKGEYDFGALFDFIGSHKWFEKRSDCEKGRFTFHLRKATDITYQVYSSGKVRIVADDCSDPATLVQIIWDAARVASKRPPMFELNRMVPLGKTSSRITWPLFDASLKSDISKGIPEAIELVEAETAKIKAVMKRLKDLSKKAKRAGPVQPCVPRVSRSKAIHRT